MGLEIAPQLLGHRQATTGAVSVRNTRGPRRAAWKPAPWPVDFASVNPPSGPIRKASSQAWHG
jgi:hypothetical protein